MLYRGGRIAAGGVSAGFAMAGSYSRCRWIGWLKEISVLPWGRGVRALAVGIPTPNHRPTRPFAGAGAAAGLLLSQFPLRPITNAALEGKESFETIGFKRRFLHTFCRC